MNNLWTQLWELTLQHPIYGLGSLVGVVVGIFYGFDGWSGDASETALLKDSPRVKNWAWIIGPGLLMFLGDVGRIDKDAEKSTLLLYFLIPVIVFAAVTVLLWGIIVFISHAILTLRRREIQYGPVDAVGDYFYYGYRHYRKQLESANRYSDFISDYLVQISYAVTAAGTVTDGSRGVLTRNILETISTIVKAYHNDKTDAYGIRSNVMIISDCDANLAKELIFVGNNRDSIRRCLQSFAYDRDEVRPKIVLPISDQAATALPGAPRALVSSNGIDVIDNINEIRFPEGIPGPIKKEVEQYFKQPTLSFRSFASIRILVRGEVIAVVNIESAAPNVFGVKKEEKERIARYLLPFCSTLAIILDDE